MRAHTLRKNNRLGQIVINQLYDPKSDQNINTVYLNEFLDKFLNEKEMEFDAKKSGVSVNYSEPICMAIDMIFEEELPSFEI